MIDLVISMVFGGLGGVLGGFLFLGACRLLRL